MINAILRLRRDNDYNYAKIKDTFIPQNGEICLVDTARSGLRAVCGDGVSTFGQLDYIGESFAQGYYSELLNNFYKDKDFNNELEKRENIIYLDYNSNQLFYYNGTEYIQIEQVFPHADENVFGIVKLYNNTGDNTDGTMTQKAITEELDNISDEFDNVNKELSTKIEVSLKEDEELVIFSL